MTGITVSPAIEQLTVQPNQTAVQFAVQVTNHTTNPVNINLRANDFTALNNRGGVSFYGPKYNPDTNPHGLASALQPQINNIILQPGQDRQVIVNIANINALAIGGHYGALSYYVTSPEGSTHAQLINNQVLSTLVFLSTAGRGTQSLTLSQPQVSSFYFKLPDSIQFVLSNNGNTQTTPRGYVSLQSASAKEVARGLVNDSSGLVLPGSQRLFNVDLTGKKDALFGGHYHYVVAYRPDGNTNFMYYQKSFLVIGFFWPWFIIVSLIIIVVLRKTKPKLPKRKKSVTTVKKIIVKSVDN